MFSSDCWWWGCGRAVDGWVGGWVGGARGRPKACVVQAV